MPTVRLSLGGAFFRLWADGHGLLTELPSCVIRNRDTGALVAFGEEAQSMEGRVPEHLEFVRPFAEDALYDRALFRALVEHIVLSNQQSLSPWQRVADFSRYHIAVPPTVPALHKTWLQRTLREAGLWQWQPYDPFLSVAQRVTQRSRSAQVVGVLDVGFSAVRAALYVGDEVVAAQRSSQLSLRNFCQQLTQEEQKRHQIQFSPSILYDQQWFVQHVGYNETQQRAVTAPVHKDTFTAVQKRYTNQLHQFLVGVMNTTAPDIQASMQYHGWTVIGGGATIPGVLDAFSAADGVPIKMYKHTRYADVRLE